MNEVARNAAKKIILNDLEDPKTMLGYAQKFGHDSAEEIGRQVCIRWEAVRMLETAFNQMSQYRPYEERSQPKNPGL